MISERIFSKRYSSFWAELLPWCERFARLINLSYDRYEHEFETDNLATSERAIVNELAFEWFAWSVHAGIPLDGIAADELRDLEGAVSSKIALLSGTGDGSIVLSNAERREAKAIARSIQKYFSARHANEPIMTSPHFPGCGFLDSCYGDAVVGRCLVEIKAGDRNFRSVDLRQVLIYAALNSVSEQYDLSEIVLLNPRRGIYYRASIEAICAEAGGHSSEEVLNEIVNFVSGLGVSK